MMRRQGTSTTPLPVTSIQGRHAVAQTGPEISHGEPTGTQQDVRPLQNPQQPGALPHSREGSKTHHTPNRKMNALTRGDTQPNMMPKQRNTRRQAGPHLTQHGLCHSTMRKDMFARSRRPLSHRRSTANRRSQPTTGAPAGRHKVMPPPPTDTIHTHPPQHLLVLVRKGQTPNRGQPSNKSRVQGGHRQGRHHTLNRRSNKSRGASNTLLNHTTQHHTSETADSVVVTEDRHCTGLIRPAIRTERQPHPAVHTLPHSLPAQISTRVTRTRGRHLRPPRGRQAIPETQLKLRQTNRVSQQIPDRPQAGKQPTNHHTARLPANTARRALRTPESHRCCARQHPTAEDE